MRIPPIACITALACSALLTAQAPLASDQAQDPRSRIQALKTRLEQDRDRAVARTRAAEAAVARNQDLVARAASGSPEAKIAAAMALDLSRQNLAQRKRGQALAEAALEAIRRVVAHPRFGDAPIQAIPLTVEGRVLVHTRDGREVALGPNPSWHDKPADRPWLEPGDQLITDHDGRITLELATAEGSMQIGPNSALSWAPKNLEQSLELAAGQVRLWLRAYRKRLEVRTPVCVTSPRGTAFEVALEPDGATLCTVTEGTVEVSDREGRVARAVSAGQRIRIPKDQVPGQPLPEPERVDVTTLPGTEARP